MQRNTLPFFVAVFAITWLLQLPAVLAHHGVIAGPFERFMPLVGLGAFGPMFAAMLAARWEAGRGGGGVRALFRPMRTKGVGVGWYVLAIATSGGLFVMGMAVYTAVAGRGAGPWFYIPTTAQTLTALVVFSVGEEVGWRGFALPRLQERHGAVTASLIVGACWALWHIPMFDLAGISPRVFLVTLPFFAAGSLVFTWIYNRTSGSLFIAILVHAGSHLNNSHKALPGNLTPVIVHTVAFCIAALAVVVADRRAFTARAPLHDRSAPAIAPS